jgi:hypothetical protein
MTGFALAQRVIAPDCPHCDRQIFLTMGTVTSVTADGTLVFDGDLAKQGMLLHLRKCQEAEDAEDGE